MLHIYVKSLIQILYTAVSLQIWKSKYLSGWGGGKHYTCGKVWVVSIPYIRATSTHYLYRLQERLQDLDYFWITELLQGYGRTIQCTGTGRTTCDRGDH